MKIAALGAVLCMLSAGSIAQVNSYKVTAIVNNTQDPFLVNPWGMSRAVKATVAENEWWTSDSATGFTTLYYANQTGSASLAPLVIMVPSANGVVPGSPTGTAYNPGVGPGPTAENFTFATLDGLITNWNAGQKPAQAGTGCYLCHTNTTKIVVNRSAAAASYTGLTFATNSTTKVPTYYAANHNGGVEAYNANTFARLTLPGAFSDPKIPSEYKPYGIQAEGSFILVTYFNDLSGGFVDAFDTNGNLKGRLSHGSWFSEPWAVALAPANFGAFSNMLLVGNTTSGRIAAFDTSTGAFKGFLQDATGVPIVLPGLWAIGFGNGSAASGPTNTLYYAAGGNYTTGEFGAIAAN